MDASDDLVSKLLDVLMLSQKERETLAVFGRRESIEAPVESGQLYLRANLTGSELTSGPRRRSASARKAGICWRRREMPDTLQ
ncbi:hypothetical protein DOTSEDRAFT_75084 [Dothistroma septosporum NZE10]|uniref:Uncharacterized protein n=1 Tax=Dothistroma septosporum (strain NZE10 / CBS 128990) TaxID=675120 RepID=M2XIE1_DOTSN|nr:hypothetical protein DOTSEDRAFT_75084 [Dothistroma septosporum NZE10]